MGPRRWMLTLASIALAAQLVDLVWPRVDARTGSPAGLVFAVALIALLALYPNGRFVPRWVFVPAIIAAGLYVASDLMGPDAAARWLWPLPIAPFLLVLVVGGQGFRYWRRSSAAEREAVRWPLLGVLVLLTLVVPVDVASVALTGTVIDEPPAALAAVVQLAFLLPTLGFLAGLVVPPNDLVDRLLAIWVAVVCGAVVLGVVFTGITLLAGLAVPQPWPAVVGAAAVAVASVWVVPLARRAGRAVVFRGRSDAHAAVTLVNRRLRATLDAAEVPAIVAEAVRESIGSRGVVLRRSGQSGTWAVAGEPDAGQHTVVIRHLGVPVADLEVSPRPAESSLAAADVRLVDEVAAASAAALHGARLASAFPELTERERQVLAGITRGLPNAAIAARLGVSSKTVANYISIVLTKLRVPDKERAAELARRRAAEAG